MMRITAEVLAAAYEYLTHTEPFRRWNLPASEDVKFVVIKDQSICGYHVLDGEQHVIAISAALTVRTQSLMETMAHEMIHMHQKHTEPMMCKGTEHNAAFRKLAAKVCKIHGFDPGLF